MARLGLERSVVDAEVLKRTAGRFRQAGVVLPTIAQLKNPATIPAAIRAEIARRRSRCVRPAQSVPRALVQRRRPQGPCRYSGLCRAADRTDRGEGAHRAAARQPLSDDPRPQGAGRLWLPGAAAGHRRVRSDAPSRGVAVDRQLLSRRRRHLAHPRLPRHRRAAGKHEPRALRLARPMGGRSDRHRPHARLGKQRQGNLRHLRRARPRSDQYHLQSVLRVRELSDPPRLHRRGDGTLFGHLAKGRAGAGSPPTSPPRDRPARSPPAIISRRNSAPHRRGGSARMPDAAL